MNNSSKTLHKNRADTEASAATQHRPTLEVITMLLYLGILSSWTLLIAFHEQIPTIILYVLGGIVICLFGSYQHEAVHNHPTNNKNINFLLGWIPLNMIYPFRAYLDLHLKHHRCAVLAEPTQDPESYYWYADEWEKKPRWLKQVYRAHNSAIGRFFLGPIVSTLHFYFTEIDDIRNGQTYKIKYWGWHILGCAIIFYAIEAFAGMPIWKYLLCFVYSGSSLSLMRSFMEHRPATSWSERTLIVEGTWFSQLLYLNNNFHVVHHEKPDLPWYKIKSLYFQEKQRILRENQHYFYKNYFQLVMKHLFTPKDEPVYPYQRPTQKS